MNKTNVSCKSWKVFTKENGHVTVVKDRLRFLTSAKAFVRDNCAIDYCDYYIQGDKSDVVYVSSKGKWKFAK